MAESGKQHLVTAVTEEKGTTCWGCGLGLLLPTLGPAFKCGWCGAITNHNLNKTQNQCLLWRRLRDRCFVSFLFSFMLFVISFPIIFLVSYTSGIVHSVITTILALTTISTFGLSAFQCAGAPPMILWGSYTVVGKGELENYTFCHYCSKPKSPRAHHCRSCGMCILDMDHHCPFGFKLRSRSRFRSHCVYRGCGHNGCYCGHCSYIQHNLRNSDVCIYEFPYMAAIEVQTARTLDHFQHGSGDVGKQGRSCGIVKLSNGTAATVLHIRRANIPQPFEFTGRGSCERKRLPESIALLRVSVFDVEILAHPAEFAKDTQDVNIFVVSGCGVISFLNFIKNCNIAGSLGVLNNGISVAIFCYGRCRARFDSIVFSHVFS
ncbi:hypothetical protein ERO13_D05G307832v2 [Gossypium hirsutum]|nr:hypothetical protein ERO13_D05G307832v2 [Gossypium hirsutum]